MGGNALNGRRISTVELQELIKDVSFKLNSVNVENKALEFFKTKADHGDLDLICKGSPLSDAELFDIFKHTETFRNGKTISILYNGVQIDLNFHDKDDFDSAFDFYRLGDVGQMVGRIAHSLGFKYGHKGLLFPVKLNDAEELGDVVISRNTEQILQFLDLNYDEWEDGFNEPKDLYKWIMKSKYFNPEMFLFANLNHINRVRNKKRPVYAGFVEYLEDDDDHEKVYNPVPKNKTEFLWNALIFFDKLKVLDEIKELILIASAKKRANELFNGNLIMKVTGLSGAELGKVIRAFQDRMEERYHLKRNNYSWSQFVLFYEDTSEEDHIMDAFTRWYTEIYQKTV